MTPPATPAAGPPQPPRPGLLEVGRIAKAHGLRGEVIVELVTDRPERTSPGAVLTTHDGDLTVSSARPHGARWLVELEESSTKESADALRGTVLWAEPLDDEGTLWVHELVGCRVVDGVGVHRGTVESVQANPAADLLVLDSGALVPVTFVVGGPHGGTVRVDVPDGLFEL